MYSSDKSKVDDIRHDVMDALKVWDASQADGMQFILQQGGREAETASVLNDVCDEVGLSVPDLIWNEAECLSMLHVAVMGSEKHSQTDKAFMLEAISCDFSSVNPAALGNRH